MNKTALPIKETLEQKWYVVNAEGQRLGRLATEIASILRGKNKPTFTPHMDTGDFVIVINAEKVVVTGRKNEQKIYHRHSGRPGGMKTETFEQLQQRVPERIIEKAVKGMLPKNAMGRKLFTKLKVYKGAEHPHQAQNPEKLVIDTIPKQKKKERGKRKKKHKDKKEITMAMIQTPLIEGYKSFSFHRGYLDINVDYQTKLNRQDIYNTHNSEEEIASSCVDELKNNLSKDSSISGDLKKLVNYSFSFCDKKNIPLNNHKLIKFVQEYSNYKVFNSSLAVELDNKGELVAINCTFGSINNVDTKNLKIPEEAVNSLKNIPNFDLLDQQKLKATKYIYFNKYIKKWILVYLFENVICRNKEIYQSIFPKFVDIVIDAQTLHIIDKLFKA